MTKVSITLPSAVSQVDISRKNERRSNLIQKLTSKPGLRNKLNAFCIECVYDPYDDGTWRKQVENCTAMTCPLFQVRPTTINSKES